MPVFRLAQACMLLTARALAVAASKHCVELEVPISVVATNNNYTIPRVDNTVESIQWAIDFSVWNAETPDKRDNGPYPVDRVFKVNAELCVPPGKDVKQTDVLQIAVQGNGWDRRYWDVSVNPEEHSYVDAAISKGYSVLMFDRIGTGKSEHPNAYNLVQVATEVEILTRLTALARDGKLLSSSKILRTTGGRSVKEPKPKHIVHVGHSFGSLLIIGLLNQHGDMSDGALLTGALPNSTHLSDVHVYTFEHEFAGDDPSRFGGFGSGYIVLTTENTLQKLYFVEGGFEPELLQYTEKVKQPEAVALYVSSEQLFKNPGPLYRGPVQMLVGESDLINCNGKCQGTYTEESIKKSTFPGASDVAVHLQPNTGHALTVAKNATGGFQVMLDYLESFNL